MNKKTKYSLSSIGVLGVLFGRFLNRELTHYIGNSASNLVVTICITVIFCVILISIIMKQYITAIGLLVGSIPLIVAGVGLYLNNMDLLGLGILLIFIIFTIMMIVTKRFKNNS